MLPDRGDRKDLNAERRPFDKVDPAELEREFDRDGGSVAMVLVPLRCLTVSALPGSDFTDPTVPDLTERVDCGVLLEVQDFWESVGDVFKRAS